MAHLVCSVSSLNQGRVKVGLPFHCFISILVVQIYYLVGILAGNMWLGSPESLILADGGLARAGGGANPGGEPSLRVHRVYQKLDEGAK